MTRSLILTLVVLLTTTAFKAAAQVPKLNSYPSASATIFLDFDGQTVMSPYWNSGMSFYCTPAAFTNEQIANVFNQVAEDFRPFNLNITTDSIVYFAAPINRRQRIIVTANSSWYGSAGGVAYLESFRWGMEIPGFVFSNLLGHNTKNVAEASSHETGHTLGLNHQTKYNASCVYQTEYNPGTGTGEIGWAPIMGNSYSKNLSLWHNGSSTSCSNLQNDLAVLASTGSNSNGFGFRTDDVGNTRAQAADVTFQGIEFAINGLINSTGDIDMFKIELPDRGRLQMTAIPFNLSGGYQSANIDLEVSLLSSNGTLLNSYNPSTSVQVLVDSVVDEGTYYLRVNNISNSNTGNYGMLGSYVMGGSFETHALLPVHSLLLAGSQVNNQHELSWNIVADETIAAVIVERSTDGHAFTKLQEVGAAVSRFAYQPLEKKTTYYRLQVKTVSQLTYYSNIISIRDANPTASYSIVSNLIADYTILVNSSGQFNWRLTDMNGRSLGSGRMNTGMNRISSSQLTKGMYLLQIQDGNALRTEKIVKQ
jgi:hypothetical protein